MSIALQSFSHVGIRVLERQRSLSFYALLGFHEIAWHETQRVSILRNERGLELNLIVNAQRETEHNVLMDVPDKYAGYTHVAFQVASLAEVIADLQAQGVTISDGPVKLGESTLACFVRDPDLNVIEFDEPLDS
jgi:catechol 2,3-dioxygenase-like lactoylglutathione lyase family enzyme